MSCSDRGDSLEATLSGAWNGYSWVTGGCQCCSSPKLVTHSRRGLTYNMVYVGTTKELVRDQAMSSVA
jgi:hypothetical protein